MRDAAASRRTHCGERLIDLPGCGAGRCSSHRARGLGGSRHRPLALRRRRPPTWYGWRRTRGQRVAASLPVRADMLNPPALRDGDGDLPPRSRGSLVADATRLP
jgi:hypothetical protein